MNNQAIFNTIEAQHENYDLELLDKMIISDLEAANLMEDPEPKPEKQTKKQIQRALDRKNTAYNNNYPIKHAAAIQLIKNRFNH